MARGGSSGRRGDGARRPGRPKAHRATPKGAPTGRRGTAPTSARATRSKGGAPDTEVIAGPSEETPRILRLGVAPGATPGKWIERWRERMPGVPLVVVPLASVPRDATLAPPEWSEVDLALLRGPVDPAGLHVIPLYDEVVVVVAHADSELTVAEELRTEDLEGRILIRPADDALPGLAVDGVQPPSFPPPATTADAIELVAAGIGIGIVPMSLARLHNRRDVEHRPLHGAPPCPVVLAWPTDRTTDDVETFVGIVRGRTTRSSR